MNEEKKQARIEERLADSFKKLVLSEEANHVTVREIAEGAGVIRATFYNHFKDKAELLSWIIREEILEPVDGLFKNGMYREATVLIFRNLQAEKEFYLAVSHMEKPVSFEMIVRSCVYDLIYDHMMLQGAEDIEHSWLTLEMVCDFYAHIITLIVQRWMASGMTISPEEVGAVYEYLGTRTLWDVLGTIEHDKSFAKSLGEQRRIREGLAQYKQDEEQRTL